jgi:hypothetical protein
VALFRQDPEGGAKRLVVAAPAKDEVVDFIAISKISSFRQFAETPFGEVAPAFPEPVRPLRNII